MIDERPLHELTVAEARRRQAAEVPTPSAAADGIEVSELAGPVPIRLYRPPADAPLPVTVWLPGGGWVLDTLDASEASCRRLAAETPCAVAAVRYRLAPEHPFPAPLDDCVAAVDWIVEHGATLGLDPARLAVGGTSAGGNLAAAVALAAHDRGGSRLTAQVLVYPALLHGAETESMRASWSPDFGPADVDWCWSHYLSTERDGESPLASPLRAIDLRELPPALVLTAEHDPLRDEAELYAERLEDAGVRVEVVRVEGAPHGFFSGADDRAATAQRRVVGALRRAFGLQVELGT